MTGDVRVVEDGIEQGSSERDPRTPAWLWLAIGLAIGIGLAIVFFLASSGEPEVAQTGATLPVIDQPDDVVSASPTTVAPESDGVGEVVDGFPDTLLAVTQLDGGNLGYLTWPVSGPPLTTTLPGFATAQVEFDSSGRMVAMATPVTDSEGSLLSLGMTPRIQPLASGVTGFAWHETEFGVLAYSQIVDGESRLSVVDRFRDAHLVASGSDVEGVVVACGDWGFAMQRDGDVTILNPTGQVARSIPGRLLDSDAEGRVVMYDGGLSIVDRGGTSQPLEADVSLVGELEVALISPDGTRLAVVGGAGHMIIPLDGSGEVTHAPVTSGFPQMAWTSDSRFLVSPWMRGVLIIDTQGGAQPVAQLTDHTIVAVATVPLGDG